MCESSSRLCGDRQVFLEAFRSKKLDEETLLSIGKAGVKWRIVSHNEDEDGDPCSDPEVRFGSSELQDVPLSPPLDESGTFPFERYHACNIETSDQYFVYWSATSDEFRERMVEMLWTVIWHLAKKSVKESVQ